MSEEEKKAIEYLKSRLYGNECCKFIDVAQSDLRIFLKLVENLQKDVVSKNKIKAKIEELKKNKDFDEDVYVEEFTVDILQSLLGKE